MNPAIDVTKTHERAAHRHKSPLISCRFDPSSKYVFFGAQDSRVWRWEIGSDKTTPFAGHDSWTRGMAFAPRDVLLTTGFDGRLIWWPAYEETPKPIRKIQAHDGWTRCVAVHPNGQLAATAGNDLVIRLWDLENGKQVQELKGHESHIYNVAFHPSEERLVSGDLKANLLDWDLETGKEVRQMKLEALHKYDKTFKADIGGVRAVDFNEDGTQLACSGITNVSNAFAGVGNPAVEVFDWKSGKRSALHLSKGKLRGVAWGVALHPEPLTIAVSGGGGGGYLLFWKPGEEHEFHQQKLPNIARDLHLAPNHIDVATAHYDGHIRVHRLQPKAKA